MKIIKNHLLRKAVFASGLLFVVCGFVGVLLPVMPTTPFLILASWCFLRSSQKAHNWLYAQPYFGNSLRDWEQHGAIRRKTKVLVITLMTVSLVSIWWFLDHWQLQWAVTLILILVAVFIGSRPEGPSKRV